MPVYEYKCPLCDREEDVVKSMAQSKRMERCPSCGARLARVIGKVNISGTRDGFGINKAFIDPESGKEVSTWKQWEKAGYKEAKETKRAKRSVRTQEAFKRKKDRLKGKVTV